MLWSLLVIMCLVAMLIAVLPLLDNMRRHLLAAGLTCAGVAAVAVGIYVVNGSPGVPGGRGAEPDIGAMVESLAQRLERQPDDVAGWKMLGRSYMTLGQFGEAIVAYERAVELEDSQNAQTLVDLGVAIAQQGGQQALPARAISSFENAIAIAPNHPEALFWSGIAAFNRGDAELAADRWETLLATDPPPEVRTILTERIAVWRGDEVETTMPAPDELAPVIGIDLSISAEAKAALPPDATVFVIARDPQQPSPPIAVARRSLAELPMQVSLGDRDAMLPGRNLSSFPEFEVVVRASASGNPVAAVGDWFGSRVVRPTENDRIEIAIAEEWR